MRLLALLLLSLLALPAAAEPFRFVAFGDMPYCRTGPTDCPAEVARVEALTTEINAARPAFSVFLGDTKAGNEACTDAIILDRTAAWFNRIAGPLVYTPGDNEWTDCWQPRAGRHDPLERLALLRARFFSAPVSLGQAPMRLLRQSDLDPAHRGYPENARWEREGVTFLTLHVPGSDNNRPLDNQPGLPPGAAAEYPARNAANLAWLEAGFAAATAARSQAVVVALQADLYFRDRCGRGTVAGHVDTRNALAEAARRFGRPVLLLHGDSHFWLEDRPAPAALNLLRVMVPGDGDTRAVVVEVDPAAATPFRFSLIGPTDRTAPPGC
ncbi:hypothetical protein JMJ55_20630 [Belnapia sp. T6]|uniref:Calcineurin-like phosphoesterase domain-containing protein n=1 Tax=Belnapia mucosa TaxID=2804532 RepID=A0ABS1V8S1_9PROT|nr:hypothetical protein [Belnapia mucosa]MBL6457747.1 hypothetical protein [Belnapia mucosa]